MEAYVSQQKKQLLDSLENQVRFSQLVAVVIGDKGMGKSFLLKQLQLRIEQEVSVASIEASLAMSEEQLEKIIALQLGLNWPEKALSLEHRIQQNLPNKALICIDDAHLLSSGCLDFILTLNQKQLQLQEPVLFVLLAGEIVLPNMINRLPVFQQQQEMCVVFQVKAIRQHETRAMVEGFVHGNMELVGDWCDEKKLSYFWQLSKGNPAELFYHLSRWLEDNTPTQVVEIVHDEKTSYLRAAFYILVVIVLVSVLIFQDEINNWIGTDTGVGIGTGVEANAQPVVVQQESTSRNGKTPLKTEKLTKNQTPTDNKRLEKTRTEAKNNLGEQVETVAVTVDGQNIDKTPKKNKKGQSSTVIQKPEHQKPNAKKPNANRPKTEKTESHGPPDSQPVAESIDKLQPKDVKTPTLSKKTPPKKEFNRLTPDETKLLSQNRQLFVLQWVGLSQLQTAQNYKQLHPVGNKMTIYRRMSGNTRLYLVISDQFLTRLQADVAKAEYKKRGYQGEPWVKSMAAVQKEIKSFQKAGG